MEWASQKEQINWPKKKMEILSNLLPKKKKDFEKKNLEQENIIKIYQ
ncbi:hypothetical protein [Mycoplasmopsis gallopavonis]|uniref:Uncharacterized protein n=1 Tax=Mycoplasmopsis gallopavonis TaxID=76629 RepID=A0A449AZF9_9BACT|nr:hypothetical protein [Mycoplasmopsis gallopavonis]VEU72882.1 Uncharacterised protein [Mycoplasmopsis gallopavonis]